MLIDDLEKAVARGSFFPVIPVCSGTGVGTLELLEIVTSGFPSPAGTPAARGVHPAGRAAHRPDLRSRGPAAGRGGQDDVGSLRRQGQPGPGVLRHHQARRDSARVGPFLVIFRFRSDSAGVRLRSMPATPTTTRTNASARCRSRSASSSGPRGAVVAGDICAIGRLSRAETGDTLSDKSDPLVLKPWTMPEPLLPIAVQAHAKTDEDKLAGRVARGWPPRTRRCASSRTRRRTRSCCGAWARRTPVWCSTRWPAGTASPSTPSNCACRCEKRSAARQKGTARHVKQSGGHGQYAVCDIEVEPLPEGSRLRVRRQGGRRLRAAPVHSQRREGRSRADGEGCRTPAIRSSTSG